MHLALLVAPKLRLGSLLLPTVPVGEGSEVRASEPQPAKRHNISVRLTTLLYTFKGLPSRQLSGKRKGCPATGVRNPFHKQITDFLLMRLGKVISGSVGCNVKGQPVVQNIL